MSDCLTEKEEFWRESVSLWEESGLSARQFCSQEGLAYQSFLSWKRRFLESSDSFVELKESELSVLELSCGEITLSIPSNLSPQGLSHLILALHQASQQC
jgi:hypothetical protein